MSVKEDSKLNRLENWVPMNAVEKSRKYKSLQVTLRKLTAQRQIKDKKVRELQADVYGIQTQIDRCQEELDSMTFPSETIVTEHAYLRYLERFEGINLEDVNKKILDLDRKEKTIYGNTVVTVFTDDSDHFNLSEREKF